MVKNGIIANRIARGGTVREEEIFEKFTNLDILRQGRWYGGKGNGEIVRECLRIVEEIERWTRE